MRRVPFRVAGRNGRQSSLRGTSSVFYGNAAGGMNRDSSTAQSRMEPSDVHQIARARGLRL
jgi:hypothetical protein